MVSAKNYALSPSVSALFSGDALKQQTEDEVLARKKKSLQAAQPAGMGLAAQTLLGMTGGNGA